LNQEKKDEIKELEARIYKSQVHLNDLKSKLVNVKRQPGQPKFDGRYMYFDIGQAFWEGSPEDLKRWSNKCLLTDEEANIIKDVVLAELDDVRSKGL